MHYISVFISQRYGIWRPAHRVRCHWRRRLVRLRVLHQGSARAGARGVQSERGALFVVGRVVVASCMCVGYLPGPASHAFIRPSIHSLLGRGLELGLLVARVPNNQGTCVLVTSSPTVRLQRSSQRGRLASLVGNARVCHAAQIVRHTAGKVSAIAR
jgi:hypothetical protein